MSTTRDALTKARDAFLHEAIDDLKLALKRVGNMPIAVTCIEDAITKIDTALNTPSPCQVVPKVATPERVTLLPESPFTARRWSEKGERSK